MGSEEGAADSLVQGMGAEDKPLFIELVLELELVFWRSPRNVGLSSEPCYLPCRVKDRGRGRGRVRFPAPFSPPEPAEPAYTCYLNPLLA